MPSKILKFIGGLLMFLMVFDAWLFIDLQVAQGLYILLSSLFLLFLIFVLFLVGTKRLKKTSDELKCGISSMVDGLPEGILIIDKDDKISIINKKAEKFLGVSRKKIVGKHFLDLSHLSDVKKIIFPLLANFKGIGQRGHSGSHKEEIEVRKNFVIELNIEPLVLGKNNIVKLVILHDITKLKYAETSKNQFISVTAHQLKAPLSNTRLSLKMLLDQSFGKISAEQQNILEKTYKNNESLIYLVDDLLKDIKIEEPGQFYDRSLANFEDLVIPVVDLYIDEMKSKKISFKFNKPEEKLPEVSVDQEKIKMVIQNLIDNAVKYTPAKGKIEVSIKEAASGRASPSEGREVEFKIKDSGIGIPEDQKQKIFTRFARGINVLKTKTVGSGLGLSIAKEIIEKHHGKIWFQSKENEGSTFFFTLPFAKK